MNNTTNQEHQQHKRLIAEKIAMHTHRFIENDPVNHGCWLIDKIR
jgi:hypothetical protein